MLKLTVRISTQLLRKVSTKNLNLIHIELRQNHKFSKSLIKLKIKSVNYNTYRDK